MDYTSFLGVLVAGLLANNCLVGNCTGIDVTMNETRSYKNASIYSLILFCVQLASSLILALCKIILTHFGLGGLLFLVAMVVVACMVQLAEFVCIKVCPAFVKQFKYFIPILACTEMMYMVGILSVSMKFGYQLLYVIFNGIGTWLVLLTIAGIKKNYTHKDTADRYSGLTLSFLVVMVLAIIFTAF